MSSMSLRQARREEHAIDDDGNASAFIARSISIYWRRLPTITR